MDRYSQLGKKIFVEIFGLMEHVLSLVSMGLLLLRVWSEERKETVIIALFSGVLFWCFLPPPCCLK